MGHDIIHLHPSKLSKKSYNTLLLLVPAIVFTIVLAFMLLFFRANDVFAAVSVVKQTVISEASTTARDSVSTTGDVTVVSESYIVDDKVQERLEKHEDLRLRLQEKLEEKVASRQAKLTARVQERVRTLFGKTETRLEAAISRLEVLISRIQSRLETLAGEGENVVAIQEQVDEAKGLLVEVEALLEETSLGFESILDSKDPKEAFVTVKDSVREIVTSLKEVHNILVHVIGDIKGLRAGTEES